MGYLTYVYTFSQTSIVYMLEFLKRHVPHRQQPSLPALRYNDTALYAKDGC